MRHTTDHPECEYCNKEAKYLVVDPYGDDIICCEEHKQAAKRECTIGDPISYKITQDEKKGWLVDDAPKRTIPKWGESKAQGARRKPTLCKWHDIPTNEDGHGLWADIPTQSLVFYIDGTMIPWDNCDCRDEWRREIERNPSDFKYMVIGNPFKNDK